MQAELSRAGYSTWEGRVIDSLALARGRLCLDSYKLPTCCKALDIDLAGYHDAEVDAVGALLVAMKLIAPSGEARVSRKDVA